MNRGGDLDAQEHRNGRGQPVKLASRRPLAFACVYRPRSEHSGERVKQPYRHFVRFTQRDPRPPLECLDRLRQPPGFAIRKRSGSWDYRGVPPESL